MLCRALGLSSNEDILNYFGEDERILATLEKDTTKNREEGLLEVYRKLRPGEPPTVESATSQIDMLFFDPRRYDLSRFGRYKMNKKLSLARRIMDHVAAENVVDPFTGEILVEADKKIDRKLAERIDAAGVNLVVLKIDDPMKDQPTRSRSSPTAAWMHRPSSTATTPHSRVWMSRSAASTSAAASRSCARSLITPPAPRRSWRA